MSDTYKVFRQSVTRQLVPTTSSFRPHVRNGTLRRMEAADSLSLDFPALQTFHRQVEQIESIKRVIQFPKLEPPPADFLVQMEDYAREAPRSLDDVQSKKVLKCP